MNFAWPIGQENKSDLGQRIRADDHKGETAICPLHGCIVESQFNGVWQLVHTMGANKPK